MLLPYGLPCKKTILIKHSIAFVLFQTRVNLSRKAHFLFFLAMEKNYNLFMEISLLIFFGVKKWNYELKI